VGTTGPAAALAAGTLPEEEEDGFLSFLSLPPFLLPPFRPSSGAGTTCHHTVRGEKSIASPENNTRPQENKMKKSTKPQDPPRDHDAQLTTGAPTMATGDAFGMPMGAAVCEGYDLAVTRVFSSAVSSSSSFTSLSLLPGALALPLVWR
jgi:hypothetical protein